MPQDRNEPTTRDGATTPVDARRYVPASVIPRPSRETIAAEDFDGERDADIEFLESLLDGVAGAPPPEPPAASDAHRTVEAPVDDLAPFRERRIDRDEQLQRRSATVSDIHLAHLVDELETVAAALRRRKAA